MATPAAADAIQISSESDEDIDTDPEPEDEDDDTPYYGGYGRCYRCSKFYICRVREPVKKSVENSRGGGSDPSVEFSTFFVVDGFPYSLLTFTIQMCGGSIDK